MYHYNNNKIKRNNVNDWEKKKEDATEPHATEPHATEPNLNDTHVTNNNNADWTTCK